MDYINEELQIAVYNVDRLGDYTLAENSYSGLTIFIDGSYSFKIGSSSTLEVINSKTIYIYGYSNVEITNVYNMSFAIYDTAYVRDYGERNTLRFYDYSNGYIVYPNKEKVYNYSDGVVVGGN